MKRPILFLSVLFVAMLASAVVVSTTISGICKSFYKDNTEKSVNVKATPSEKHLSEEIASRN